LNAFIYPYPICQRTKDAFALSQKLKGEGSKPLKKIKIGKPRSYFEIELDIISYAQD